MLLRSHRMLTLVGLACLLALAVASQGLAKSGAAKGDQGWRGFAVDPRSNGALNIEAARNPQPAPPALFPGLRTINPQPVNDPSADATAQDTQSETTALTSGTDGSKVVVAFNDSGSFLGGVKHFTGYSRSTNVGASFTDKGRLPNSAEGDAGDPVLAGRTGTNTLYMATLGFDTGENIQIFKSTDGANTFGAPVNGTPGFAGSNDFQDKEWLAVDNFAGPGNLNVYLCWTNFLAGGGANIRFTRSTNGGASFGPSGGTLLSGGGQGCYVAVGPGHEVYVFYYRGTGGGGQGGDNKLFVRKSTDQGVTFAPEVQVADLLTTSTNGDLALNGGVRSNSFPHAAVNPVSGDIVVTYNDDPAPAGGADHGDIFYTKSLDGGATWSAPVRVNDDPARDQFFPTVAINPAGNRVMFGYYSRSHDPDNLMLHRRGRAGKVGLATGKLSLRKSFQLGPDTPVVIGQDPVINTTYMGDYDQIATNEDTFFSSFSDSRDGNSFHAFQPDVRMARIAQSAPVTNTDLRVTVTPVPATIDEGDQTTVQVRATAIGNDARDAFVSLAPPNGLNYTAVSGGGCKLINGFVGCSLGAIPAGTTVQRNVTATGTQAGSRVAKALGTTSDHDTNNANNTDTGVVTVNSVAKVTETYSTGDIAVPIPDTSTVDVPLAIGPDTTLFDVNATVRLNHTFDSDLVISLVPPGGGPPIVTLANRRGGSGDNYGSGANSCLAPPTVFDDEAATAIGSGVAPFAGSFRPDAPLSALDGLDSGGTWNLRVADTAGLDTGTIGCFKITIRRAAP